MPLHVALLATHIHTGTSAAVQSQSLGALAAEGTLGVHTAAIGAHPREYITLVDIFTGESLHPGKASGAGRIDLAAFTGTTPGGAQCGAALRFQRSSVDVHLTAAILDIQPARSLHTVHADGVGGIQLAAMGTFTVEGPRHVTATAIHTRAGLTLVDVFAGLGVRFEDVSFGTGAGVGAGGVPTLAVITQ